MKAFRTFVMPGTLALGKGKAGDWGEVLSLSVFVDPEHPDAVVLIVRREDGLSYTYSLRAEE